MELRIEQWVSGSCVPVETISDLESENDAINLFRRMHAIGDYASTDYMAELHDEAGKVLIVHLLPVGPRFDSYPSILKVERVRKEVNV